MNRALLIGPPGDLTTLIAQSCDVALNDRWTLETCVESSTIEQRLTADQYEVVLYLTATEQGAPDSVKTVGATLDLIASASVGRLVVVSNAAIEAPRHVHPGMVRERRRPVRGVNRSADAWSAIEDRATSICDHNTTELTILRPATIPTPASADVISRLVCRPVTTTAVGHDPPIQLLDPEDLGRALARVTENGGGGIFHVAPAGVVPLHDAVRLSGGLRFPLPMWLLRTTQKLSELAGGPPADDVERLRYTATVSGEKFEKHAGYSPRFNSAEVARRNDKKRHHEPAPTFDDFGQSTAYIALLRKTILRFLHDFYWRIDITGSEHIPRNGAAVLTGMHRGFMPFDGTMALFGVARETERLVRFLIHPSLVKMPFLADFMRRQGGLMACRDNADRVLQNGDLLGVYPEGIGGAFIYYREAYTLRRDFGRDEYVKAALRNRAPIVPFVTVGSAEIFPVLAKIDWGWWKRFTSWPCFPVAPPFPLAPAPLPSKWHTRFLEPIPVHEEHPPQAANDRKTVETISTEVKKRMQLAVDDMLVRRRHVFFGSLSEDLADRESKAAPQ